MTLIIYLISIILLSLLLRKRDRRSCSLLITGFNLIFAAFMFLFVQIYPGITLGEFFSAVGNALYAAPAAISFQGDTSLFSPDATYVFFLMSLYTVRAVLALFFQQLFVRSLMKWRIFTHKCIYIVLGERKDAACFIRNLDHRVAHPAIIYISNQETDEPLLNAYEADFSFLHKLKKGKEYHVVLLPTEGLYNHQQLVELEEQGKQGISLHVTAFTKNELLRLDDVVFPHLDLYLLSQEQMVVQDFLSHNLPLARLCQMEAATQVGHIFRPKSPFRLCILGFGAFAQEFLLQTFENTAFITASGEPALEVLIIDSALADKKSVFLNDFPYFEKASYVQWMDVPIPSEEFFQGMSSKQFHQILISTQDTEENIRLTLRLRRLFARNPNSKLDPQLVVALFREDSGAVALFQDDENVIFQQVNQYQFTYEKLIARSADQQAEELHRQYQHGSLFVPKWRELGTFTQSSNRAVVWDIPNKLLLAGDISPLDTQDREKLYWELAQYEHLRWNAFHFARGWMPLPLDELTSEEQKQFRLKHPTEKRHACLVTWDLLDTLPQREPGLLKRYDYENVTALFSKDK